MTLRDLPIGSIITDKKTKFNGKVVEWLVADHEKFLGTVLLSKNILCCRPFDKPKEYYVDEYRKKYGSNRWSTSDLRKWLNNEFFGKAFSNRLAKLTISPDIVTKIPECDRDPSNHYYVEGLEDKVFLLSDIEIGDKEDREALELFEGEDKRKYLTAEVCPGLAWYWWLRSPDAEYSYSVRSVDAAYGTRYNRSAYSAEFGVRPACVISDSAPVKERKNGGYKFYWEEENKNVDS